MLPQLGQTALHLAAVQGSADITYALLNAGADPLCTDHSGGWTPIHAAARADTTVVLDVLLEAAEPCNVDVRSLCGDTPLHRASFWGCHKAVEMLDLIPKEGWTTRGRYAGDVRKTRGRHAEDAEDMHV